MGSSCFRWQLRKQRKNNFRWPSWVDRVLGLQSSELGPPHPQSSVFPPPLVTGGGHIRLQEGRGGGGEITIPTREVTLWYSRYICTLWRGHRWGGQPRCRIGRSDTGLSTYLLQPSLLIPAGQQGGGGHVADRQSSKDRRQKSPNKTWRKCGS